MINKQTLQLLKKFKSVQLMQLSLMLLGSLLTVAQVYLLGKIIDHVYSFFPLVVFLCLQIGVKFLGDFLNYSDARLQIKAKKKVHDQLSHMLIQKISKLAYSTFEDKEIQNTLHFVSNTPHEKLLNCIINFNTMLSMLLNIILILLMVTRVSWLLSIVTALLIGGMVFMNYKTIRIYNDMYFGQSENERWSAYHSDLLNQKNDFLSLKVINGIENSVSSIHKRQEAIVKEKFSVAIKSKKYYFISVLFMTVMIIALLGTLTLKAVNHSVSMGIVLSTIALMPMLINYADQCGFTISTLGENFETLKRLTQFMALDEMADLENELKPSEGITIEFVDVWFKYPSVENWALNGVSFKIKAGEKIGVVGKNGCGKSTLMHLILGLYKPQKGQIRIDGKPLNTFHYKELSKHIAVVFQDFHRYEFFLKDQFDTADWKDSAFVNALFENKSQWEHQPLGKSFFNGIDLSGGQWQKLAIARALHKPSSLVVLDEPTSAIDPLSERALYEDFAKLINKQATSIMVSHRLNSLKTCQKILVLDSGRVVAFDTHETLMTQCHLYQEMQSAQNSWYQENKEENHAENL